MASSGYVAWSVVADEQPTAAKWNILGSNDASFNNGNGFEDNIILPRHMGADVVGDEEIDWSQIGFAKLVYSGSGQGLGGTVIGSGGEATLPFDLMDSQAKGITKPANGQLTVDKAGVYFIGAAIGFADVPNDLTLLQIRTNTAGTVTIRTPWNRIGFNGNNRGTSIGVVCYLAAGTICYANAANTSPNSTRLNWWTNREEAYLTVARIS